MGTGYHSRLMDYEEGENDAWLYYNVFLGKFKGRFNLDSASLFCG